MRSALRQADTPLAPALEKRTGLVLWGIICSGKCLPHDMYSCPPDDAHAVKLVKRWRVEIAPAISKWKKLLTQSPRCPHCDKPVRSSRSEASIPLCALFATNPKVILRHQVFILKNTMPSRWQTEETTIKAILYFCVTNAIPVHQEIQGGLRECIAVKAPQKRILATSS